MKERVSGGGNFFEFDEGERIGIGVKQVMLPLTNGIEEETGSPATGDGDGDGG